MNDNIFSLIGTAMLFGIPTLLYYLAKSCVPAETNENSKGGRIEFPRQWKPGHNFYGQTLVNLNGIEIAYEKNKQVALGEQYPTGVFAVHVAPSGIKVVHYPIVGGAQRVVAADQVPAEIKRFALDFRQRLLSAPHPS